MKHLLIGLDGTWRAAYHDTFHSNVYRLNLSLEYRDKNNNPQIFIYSAGVGTVGKSARLPGGAFGEGLDATILQAYINLVANYEEGDKIYVFGFSRGAVAARALSGLISRSGLLKANSAWLIEHAWNYFTGNDSEFPFLTYKADNTHKAVTIEFIGVWDTVCGPIRKAELFKRYRFESLSVDPIVNHAIHILAIDDTRRHFAPVPWSMRDSANDKQVMEQIWMPGVHTDVGGGYPKSFISTLSLLLMIDKLSEFCGDLVFDDEYIRDKLLPNLEGEVAVNDEWTTRFGFRNHLAYWFVAEDASCRRSS